MTTQHMHVGICGTVLRTSPGVLVVPGSNLGWNFPFLLDLLSLYCFSVFKVGGAWV